MSYILPNCSSKGVNSRVPAHAIPDFVEMPYPEQNPPLQRKYLLGSQLFLNVLQRSLASLQPTCQSTPHFCQTYRSVQKGRLGPARPWIAAGSQCGDPGLMGILPMKAQVENNLKNNMRHPGLELGKHCLGE